MDWIERLTGLSLDGGNGSIELVITLAVLTVLCVIALATWKVVGHRALQQ